MIKIKPSTIFWLGMALLLVIALERSFLTLVIGLAITGGLVAVIHQFGGMR